MTFGFKRWFGFHYPSGRGAAVSKRGWDYNFLCRWHKQEFYFRHIAFGVYVRWPARSRYVAKALCDTYFRKG